MPSGGSHISRKPVYILHTSYPIRKVAWRPGYECELAVASYLEGPSSNQPNPALDLSTSGLTSSPRLGNVVPPGLVSSEDDKALYSRMGDPVEVWDVRRGYIAKWTVRGSAVEGGVTGMSCLWWYWTCTECWIDIAWADSHTMWAQHFSGSFSQLDLRSSVKTLDAVPRTCLSWDAAGSLTFVAERPRRWEVPYDDM